MSIENIKTWETLNVIDCLKEENITDDPTAPFKYIVLNRLFLEESLNLDAIYEELKQYSRNLHKEWVENFLYELDKSDYIVFNTETKESYIYTKGKTYISDTQAKYTDSQNKLDEVIHDIHIYIKQTTKDLPENSKLENQRLVELLIQFIKKTSISELQDINNTTRRFHNNTGIIASFVLWAIDNTPKSFEIICELVTASTLFSVWDVPQDPITSLTSTKFYLDTPFLFMLSGSHGKDAKETAEHILSFILNKRGKLYMFDSTKNELEKIIEDSKNIYNSSYYDSKKANRLTLFFRENRHSKFSERRDVEAWIIKFEKILYETYRIEIDRHEYSSDPVYNSYQIDEEKLEQRIRLPRENESNIDAINTDIKNIVAIYKIRLDDGEKRYNYWKNTPAVFLTTSMSLVYACNEIRQGIFNHYIPAILLQNKMLYIMHNSSYKDFKQHMKLELLSFAHMSLETLYSKIYAKMIDENGYDMTKEYDKVLIEIAVNELRDPLLITQILEDNPKLIDSNDFMKSYDIVKASLDAQQQNEILQKEKETANQEAESERLAKETAKKEANTERLAKETAKGDANTERLAKETAKGEANTERLAKETAKKETNTERLAKETAENKNKKKNGLICFLVISFVCYILIQEFDKHIQLIALFGVISYLGTFLFIYNWRATKITVNTALIKVELEQETPPK